MEEVFEDVTKVHEQIVKALGHNRGVNPNQIFDKLEALLNESSSVRVNKVVQDIISEQQPAHSRSRSIEIENKTDVKDAGEEMGGSENEEPSHELEEDILMDDNFLLDKANIGEEVKRVENDEAGLDPDSLRSTPASIISITDEDR